MSDIRAVLSPLFLTSYVLGIRIIEFPVGEPRLWCSLVYMLLLWTIYYFILYNTVLLYVFGKHQIFQFLFSLHTSLIVLLVVLGIYHDKKYRTCLRKLAIVDNTLEKLGMVTDYQKLYTKMLVIIFGWFAYMICITCAGSLWHRDYYTTIYSTYISFMCDYTSYVNILDDIIIITTLGYIELKFEQLNEYLRKLEGYNNHRIKRGWEHSRILLPYQTGYPKSTSSAYTTWLVIHLHLELCKISRVLNSIFGLQMTIKIGAYFVFEVIRFNELFNIFLVKNYHKKKILLIIFNTNFIVINIFRLFIINYICEKVHVKAKTTGDYINRISYSSFDVVSRENISQFLLQLNLRPLKFCGLGLFQFGLKFLYGFCSFFLTVIVILIQSRMDTYKMNRKM